MAEPTTIADALNSVNEEDIKDDVAEETTEPDQSLLDEPDAEEAEEEKPEGETHTGDVEGEGEEEGESEEEDSSTARGEVDPFDSLTSEQIARIKADPDLNKLRKQLMRGYSEKTSEVSQLVTLGNEWRKNPVAVLKNLADSIGFSITPAQAAAAAAATAQPDTGQDAAGAELEQLFGPQIGPKVRAVFDKWAEARLGSKLAPVTETLGRVVSQGEQARMLNEEQAFKSRHKDLTPEVEREIVALGNSGKIVPGDMSPSEYLDTLYDVVMARQARAQAKKATATASTKLAKKIEANRRDREPSGVGTGKSSVKPVSKISGARSISEALDLAMAELESESR